jgi:hypothetical protein
MKLTRLYLLLFAGGFSSIFAPALLSQTNNIPIPDNTFSISGGPNTLTSLLLPGDQIAQLGTTPWYSELQTPIGLGLLTSADITGGKAVISNPLSLGIGNSAGYIFQNLGKPYDIGTYTLTTTFTGSSVLSLSLLSNSGIGVGFLDNATATTRGTVVVDSIMTPSLLSLTALNGNSATLTFTFQNNTLDNGNLGIELFSGNTSLLQAGLLSGGSFGSVTLTYTEPPTGTLGAPEPPFTALIGIGFLAIIGIITMRPFFKKNALNHLRSADIDVTSTSLA